MPSPSPSLPNLTKKEQREKGRRRQRAHLFQSIGWLQELTHPPHGRANTRPSHRRSIHRGNHPAVVAVRSRVGRLVAVAVVVAEVVAEVVAAVVAAVVVVEEVKGVKRA